MRLTFKLYDSSYHPLRTKPAVLLVLKDSDNNNVLKLAMSADNTKLDITYLETDDVGLSGSEKTVTSEPIQSEHWSILILNYFHNTAQFDVKLFRTSHNEYTTIDGVFPKQVDLDSTSYSLLRIGSDVTSSDSVGFLGFFYQFTLLQGYLADEYRFGIFCSAITCVYTAMQERSKDSSNITIGNCAIDAYGIQESEGCKPCHKACKTGCTNQYNCHQCLEKTCQTCEHSNTDQCLTCGPRKELSGKICVCKARYRDLSPINQICLEQNTEVIADFSNNLPNMLTDASQVSGASIKGEIRPFLHRGAYFNGESWLDLYWDDKKYTVQSWFGIHFWLFPTLDDTTEQTVSLFYLKQVAIIKPVIDLVIQRAGDGSSYTPNLLFGQAGSPYQFGSFDSGRWTYLFISADYHLQEINCIIDKLLIEQKTSEDIWTVDFSEDQDVYLALIGGKKETEIFRGFIRRFVYQDQASTPVDPSCTPNIPFCASPSDDTGKCGICDVNLSYLHNCDISDYFDQSDMTCKKCNRYCPNGCVSELSCSQCSNVSCAECPKIGSIECNVCQPFMTPNTGQACVCDPTLQYDVGLNRCFGASVGDYLFDNPMPGQKNWIENRYTSQSNIVAVLGADTNLLRPDEPITILGRGLYFNGKSSLLTIRDTNFLNTRRLAGGNNDTASYEFWFKVASATSRMYLISERITSKPTSVYAGEIVFNLDASIDVFYDSRDQRSGSFENIESVHGQWTYLAIVLSNDNVAAYTNAKLVRQTLKNVQKSLLRSAEVVIGAQVYTNRADDTAYQYAFHGFIYRLKLERFDIGSNYVNALVGKDDCTPATCTDCSDCKLSDEEWNKYLTRECAAHCKRGCRNRLGGSCSLCFNPECQYCTDPDSNTCDFPEYSNGTCAQTPDTDSCIEKMLRLSFVNLKQAMVDSSGKVVAVRGSSATAPEDVDPILLPDDRELYFRPTSYITVLQTIPLDTSQTLTTWIKLIPSLTQSIYTLFTRTQNSVVLPNQVAITFQLQTGSNIGIHLVLGDKTALSVTTTAITTSWAFVSLSWQKYLDKPPVTNTRARLIINNDHVDDQVLTGIGFSDNPNSGKTIVGANGNLAGSRRLQASNAWSGYISQFTLWFGLMTVPYVEKYLAIDDPSCKAGCNSLCLPADKTCLPPQAINQKPDLGTCACNNDPYVPCTDSACYKCHDVCSHCDGPTEKDCLACVKGYIFSNGACTCPPDREYDQTGIYCICKKGFFEDLTTKECQECHKTCLTCTSAGSSSCLSCNPADTLLRGECLNIQCDESKYLDYDIKSCKDCHERCFSCRDSTNANCISCNKGYFLRNSSCVICSEISGYSKLRAFPLSDSTLTAEQRNCVEICGDGRNFGTVACDDGNLSNGDGCTDTCQVEGGFVCTGGTQSSPDVCSETIAPTMTLTCLTSSSGSSLKNDKIKVRATFSEPVNLPDSLKISLSTSPSRKHSFTSSIDVETGQISLTISPAESFKDTDVVTMKLMNGHVTDKSGNDLLNYEASTTTVDYTVYDSDAQADAESLQQASAGAQASAGGASGAVALISSSVSSSSGSSIGMSSLWHMIEIVQIMNVYRYLNLTFPPNLKAFFGILGFCQAEFLPNMFEQGVQEDDLEGQTAPRRYEELDVNANFLLNAGNMIQIWILVLIVYPIILCMANTCGRKCSIFAKWKSDYQYAVFFRAGVGSFIELCLASFLQISKPSMGNGIVAASTLAAIATLIWIILFPFFILNVVNKQGDDTLNDEAYKRKFGVLYDEFKRDRFWTKNYIVILLLRRVLLCGALVWLHDYPKVQLILAVALNFFVLMFVLVVRPYAIPLYNIVETVGEFLTMSSLIAISYYYYSEISPNSQEGSDCGWIVIGLMAGVIAVHAVVILATTIAGLCVLIKKCRNRNKVQDKIKQTRKLDSTVDKIQSKSHKKSKIAPSSDVGKGKLSAFPDGSTSVETIEDSEASTRKSKTQAKLRRKRMELLKK